MAGICGIVRPTGDASADPAVVFPELRILTTATRERGPHLELLPSATAALATVSWDRPDLLIARGHGVTVLADARLDDRDDLRRNLGDALPAGVSEAPTDADLVLAAYVRWGEDLARHLLGDFAVAVWDETRRTLVLARDPMGIKPLHYTPLSATAGGFAFASEAWPLAALRTGHPTPALDRLAVARYLAGIGRGRERSLFEGVSPVEPGETVVSDPAGPSRRALWDPAQAPRVRHRAPRDYADELRDLLRRSIRRRATDAGAVTGIAMSGGLDSCAVAALARDVTAPVAFSLTFEGLAFCDESSGIDAMERAVGLPVDRIATREYRDWTAVESVGDAPLLVWEQSFAEMTHRLRARGGRVLLTGHGADDLLGGSPLMLAARLQGGDASVIPEILTAARRHGFPPVKSLYRRLVRPFLPPAVERVLGRLGRRDARGGPSWLHPDLSTLLRGDTPPAPPSRRRARDLGRWQLLDTVRRLPGLGETLSWTDRVASRAGVEIRHPFLDRELVEWVLGVPPEMLFALGEHKPLLRRAVGDLLPPEVLERPAKARLGAHVDECVRGERIRVEPWLEAPGLAEQRLVCPERLASAARKGADGPPQDVYRALFLEGWWRQRVATNTTVTNPVSNSEAFAA